MCILLLRCFFCGKFLLLRWLVVFYFTFLSICEDGFFFLVILSLRRRRCVRWRGFRFLCFFDG